MDAPAILDAFAARTGLTGEAQPRRYLWTDALATLTWVGLYETTGERRFLELALRLVGEVHRVLGAHAPDPAHPTARGLRIGKPLPERTPQEPYDPETEWDRDGQYFHYLTKWMQALQRVGEAAADERYARWAADLCRSAHAAFAYPRGAPLRMYWKMSIDLSRPLVSAMGAHDALEGLVEAAALGLERETRELRRMCAGRQWATGDPLGAGGLLLAALRLARLVSAGRSELASLLPQVLHDAARSVETTAAALGGPATRRLPFRELGLALGLHAVAPLAKHAAQTSRLQPFAPAAATLEAFWLGHMQAATWIDHHDINAVTLAACLAPQGALG